jgi:hypothetical protein
MKPTLRAEKPQQEDWEKECKQEFIETFEYCEKYGLDTKDIISSLGIGVCKQERQRLIDEVRELVDGMRKNTTLSHACLQSWGGCDCNDNKNYNQALDDLLQELNKLKGIK